LVANLLGLARRLSGGIVGGASDTGRLLVPGGLGVPPGFKETMP
jgi:hypothetical protein